MQRASFSIDLVAELHQEQVDRLLDQLKTTYYFDFKDVKEAVCKHTSFEGIHFESMLKITIFLAQSTAFEQEIYHRIQQRMLVENGSAVCIASPEDVVLTHSRSIEQQVRSLMINGMKF